MTVRILIGDMRERLKGLPDASVDSCVCDPPYHLTSIVKRFGSATAAPAKVGKTGVYARASKGFMGQTWDGGDVAFDPETWAEVLRVLKPGGHLVAFSGTRTYHRMAVAIEDAGFEVRDQLAWVFASGFPKSHNLDKAIGDENRCVCRAEALPERDLRLVRDTDVSAAIASSEMRGEILLPCVSEQGSSGAVLRAEPEEGSATPSQSGVEGRRLPETPERELQRGSLCAGASVGEADGESGRLHHGASASDGADVRFPADPNGSGEPQGPQPGEQSPVEPGTVADECGSQAGGSWPVCGGCRKPIVPTGYGSALKPAYEPICLARKPLQGTILRNFLTHGTGALNIDGARVPVGPEGLTKGGCKDKGGRKGFGFKDIGETPEHPLGRWPANLCHDGSDEVLAGFPETAQGSDKLHPGKPADTKFGQITSSARTTGFADGGSAARFFYCAKSSSEERGEGNNHPTVKPVALMRWLVRLVTPVGGTVLDPFAGSGSTLVAADAEQFNAIGCELSPEYAEIARKRIARAAGMFADVSVECTGPSSQAAA